MELYRFESFDAHSADHLELVLEAFSPDRFDALLAGGRQTGAHRTPVLRIRHPLHQPVPLQVVDQTGDVARRRVELVSQVAQRAVADSEEPEHDAQPALAEVVLLCPALLHHAQRLARDPQGGQRLHG